MLKVETMKDPLNACFRVDWVMMILQTKERKSEGNKQGARRNNRSMSGACYAVPVSLLVKLESKPV